MQINSRTNPSNIPDRDDVKSEITSDQVRTHPIRTLVAEDSTTARRLLVSILSGDPDFQVVGEAADGAEAIRKAIELSPDLITMDVHMPVVDGIDATKAIMREMPTPIMVVTAAAIADVELSLNALQAGALMVVDKPVDPLSDKFPLQSSEFLTMAKAMAGVKVVRRWSGGAAPREHVRERSSYVDAPAQLVAIGSSAGGPAALRRIFIDLPRDFPVPIVVVQHIARGFIDGLVRWLGLNCALQVKVAEQNEALRAGTIYLAPDDYHLCFNPDGHVRLSSDAPIGGFRPSANALFDSCGRTFGSHAISVILTGMGSDGREGLQTVHDAEGRVLAQDEASSLVYGMAREAVRAGVVDEIIPLEKIAGRLLELVGRT